jgi:uncharacterized protein
MIKNVFLFLLLFLFSHEAKSFDCALAYNLTEKAICRDQVLKTYDGILSQEYNNVLNVIMDSDKIIFINEQRKWILSRNSCASDVPCILNSYRHRVSQLREMYSEKNEFSRGIGIKLVNYIYNGSKFGAKISQVCLNGSASKSGVLVGDIIFGVDDKPVSNVNDFHEKMSSIKNNQQYVYVDIMRPTNNPDSFDAYLSVKIKLDDMSVISKIENGKRICKDSNNLQPSSVVDLNDTFENVKTTIDALSMMKDAYELYRFVRGR